MQTKLSLIDNFIVKCIYLIFILVFTEHSYSDTLEDIDWSEVNHCTATYYHTSVQTFTGKLLAGTDGWKTTDFPKTVIDGECHVKGGYDHVVVYEGKQEWTPGRHFFYINYLEDTDNYSINGQSDPSYSHAQWNITESALLVVNNTVCFISDEIHICFYSER